MSNVISLDDIREAADKKFGHTDIEVPDFGTVRLRNALQLPKEDRKALMSAQDDANEASEAGEEADELEAFAKVIRIVARSEKEADALIEAVGDNLAHMAQVFEAYSKGTELGEA